MEERGDGAEGIRAYYAELVDTDGKRLRDCHFVWVLDLRKKISPADASKSLRYLRP